MNREQGAKLIRGSNDQRPGWNARTGDDDRFEEQAST